MTPDLSNVHDALVLVADAAGVGGSVGGMADAHRLVVSRQRQNQSHHCLQVALHNVCKSLREKKSSTVG